MSAFETPTLVVGQDRTVTIPGLSMPSSEVVRIRRLDGKRAIITIKVPSHKYWSGIGQPWRTAPVQFEIFEYVWTEESGREALERFIGAVTGEGSTLEGHKPGETIRVGTHKRVALTVRSLTDFELRAVPLHAQPEHHRPKMDLRERPQAIPAT